eukprot:Rhum_TRINITY_DN8287_c0_g2::Rhum_TRINITY_DN8287_c0_g2_i1::g.27071::m.27071
MTCSVGDSASNSTGFLCSGEAKNKRGTMPSRQPSDTPKSDAASDTLRVIRIEACATVRFGVFSPIFAALSSMNRDSPSPATSEHMLPRPAAASVDSAITVPSECSIASPHRIIRKLSTKPKPTIGTPMTSDSRSSCSVVGAGAASASDDDDTSAFSRASASGFSTAVAAAAAAVAAGAEGGVIQVVQTRRLKASNSWGRRTPSRSPSMMSKSLSPCCLNSSRLTRPSPSVSNSRNCTNSHAAGTSAFGSGAPDVRDSLYVEMKRLMLPASCGSVSSNQRTSSLSVSCPPQPPPLLLLRHRCAVWAKRGTRDSRAANGRAFIPAGCAVWRLQ